MTNEFDDLGNIEEQDMEKIQDNIRKYVDEIKDTVITTSNHKAIYDQVVANTKFISTTIVSINETQRKHIKKYKNYLENKEIKTQMEQEKIAPKEMVDEMVSVFLLERDKFQWRIIYGDLFRILCFKDRDVIGSVNAMDLEREVLKRFNEKSEADRDMFKQVINNIVKINSNDMNSMLKIYRDETMHEIRKIRDKVDTKFSSKEDLEVSPHEDTFLDKTFEPVEFPPDKEELTEEDLVGSEKVSFEDKEEEVVEEDIHVVKDTVDVPKISKSEYRTKQSQEATKDFAELLDD